MMSKETVTSLVLNHIQFKTYRYCCSGSNQEKCLVEIGEKLSELERAKWRAVARELHGEDPFQFLRAYSPGIIVDTA